MQVRQTQRLRPSGTAERYLLREYGKCRFLWNELVSESKRRYANDPHSTFGYAEQDKFLTALRNATAGKVIDSATGTNWLSEGSSVVQQQLVRDFAKSRKKALLDRKNKIPVAKRHGLPRYKKRDKVPQLELHPQGFLAQTASRNRAARAVVAWWGGHPGGVDP